MSPALIEPSPTSARDAIRRASIASRRPSPAAAPRCSIAPPTGRIIAPSSRSPPTASGFQRAAVALAAAAIAEIDLAAHAGVHPRIGALDVLPFVPLGSASMDDAVAIAHAVGRAIAQTLHVPVFLYEAAARSAERRPLEALRRGDSPAWRPVCASRRGSRTTARQRCIRRPAPSRSARAVRSWRGTSCSIAPTCRWRGTSRGASARRAADSPASRRSAWRCAHRPGPGVDEPDRLPHDVDGRGLPCGGSRGATSRRSHRGQRDHRPRAARRARRSRRRRAAPPHDIASRCSRIDSPRAGLPPRRPG